MAAGDVTVALTANNSKKCAKSSAITDKINVGSDSSLDNIWDGPGGSINAWIKIESEGGGTQGRILDKENGVGWAIFTTGEAADKVKLELFYRWTGALAVWITTNTVVTNNTWTHIAVTYDADSTANNPIFYINGTKLEVGTGITESTAPVGARNSDAAQDLIISNRTAGSRQLIGEIADVQVHNCILTDDEITQTYQGTPVTRCLVSRWNFANNDYTDLFGSNDGTNTGTTIEIVDDVVALQLESQRTSADDTFIVHGTKSGKLYTIGIEE